MADTTNLTRTVHTCGECYYHREAGYTKRAHLSEGDPACYEQASRPLFRLPDTMACGMFCPRIIGGSSNGTD